MQKNSISGTISAWPAFSLALGAPRSSGAELNQSASQSGPWGATLHFGALGKVTEVMLRLRYNCSYNFMVWIHCWKFSKSFHVDILRKTSHDFNSGRCRIIPCLRKTYRKAQMLKSCEKYPTIFEVDGIEKISCDFSDIMAVLGKIVRFWWKLWWKISSSSLI